MQEQPAHKPSKGMGYLAQFLTTGTIVGNPAECVWFHHNSTPSQIAEGLRKLADAVEAEPGDNIGNKAILVAVHDPNN